jgi:hypothetical protein
MAKRLHGEYSIAVPRRTRSRVDSAAVTRPFKRTDRSTGALSTGETPTLPQSPLDVATTQVAAAGRRGVEHAATVEARPPGRFDRASGSRRVVLGPDGTPTLQLTPLEIEAIAQGSEAARATEADLGTTPTVESVRIALGSSPIPPMTLPATANARGPRRARETLRVDRITSGPTAPSPPPRKR